MITQKQLELTQSLRRTLSEDVLRAVWEAQFPTVDAKLFTAESIRTMRGKNGIMPDDAFWEWWVKFTDKIAKEEGDE